MFGVVLAVGAVVIFLVILLIFRIYSLINVASGTDKKMAGKSRNFNATLFALFFLGGFGLVFWYSFTYFDEYNLPLASEHGKAMDNLFWITMAVTGIVFFVTHVLLFFFPAMYKFNPKKRALFYPDNSKLEIMWTTVPAIVLAILVFSGLKTWNDITDDAPEDAIVFEAVGYQFAWEFRYPGNDQKLADHDYQKINLASNPLGIDYTDPNFRDDFVVNEIHVPVGRPVMVKIRARDVLHSFFLPHFRVKMDAVPGMPTSFWFTPTKTTAEMRQELGNPEFNYELACTEVCGKGHFSMKRVLVVDTEEEYQKWLSEQESWASLNQDYLAEVAPEQFEELTALKK